MRKKKSRSMGAPRWRAAALLALAAGAGSAAADDARRWVQGSWVNLRAAASATAPVLGPVTANTPVRLLRQQGDACEIATPGGSQGFVPCRLLAARPLDLAQVGTPELPDGRPNPEYSAPRAFWMAPSVARLLDAGAHFWRTLLSPAQRQREQPPELPPQDAASPPAAPALLRYPVPEFEAMKALLQAGVVAAPEQARAPLPWQALRAQAAQERGGFRAGTFWFHSEDRALLLQATPGPAWPSLFRHAGELAGPAASVEELSARFGVKERIRILRGPRWGVMDGRDFVARYDGAWDIGLLEARLERPVIEQAVGREGLVGAATTHAAQRFHAGGGEAGCVDGFALQRRGEQALPQRPRVKDPLLWFYTAAPLPHTRAAIASRRIALPAVDPASDPDAELAYQRLVMHEIDLDGDAVADLAVGEGWRPSIIADDGKPQLLLKLVLVNLAGRWHLLDIEHAGECT